VHPPTALGEDGARALDERARSGGARLVGTGVNPGFLLDALPAFYGTMATRVDRLLARRVSDVRHWGDGALDDEVCLGQPPEDVRGNRALSLDESMAAIVEALGIAVDRTEDLHEALPAPTPRSYRDRQVEVGQTVGFRRRSIAFRGDRPVVEVEWVAIFCIDPRADGVEESATLTIEGDCDVEAISRGTFFGDPYPSTAARALNAIAPLRTLPPGLYRPHEIPGHSVPR
jgi:2,4-diaminopentanoate dehydrogenase